jgi:hypothetical protein
MAGRNAKHEAPHAWTNGFLGVGSRLGADVVCCEFPLRLMVYVLVVFDLCSAVQ